MYQLPDDLVALYNEGHRHYHDANHIEFCLMAFRGLKWECPESYLSDTSIREIVSMIWFHDAIYDVGPDVKAGDNERRSAELWMKSSVAQSFSLDSREIVRDGILMSAAHIEYQRPVRFSDSQKIFLDIDLCGMGQSYEFFLDNGEKIRREYAWVNSDSFMEARVGFFQGLLERQYLYYNPVMRAMYEAPTRRNINRWLANPT